MKIYHFDKNISRNLDIIIKDHFKNHLIFNKSNLTDIKSEIDNYHYRIWNRSKKNINNYEYIYTSSDLSKNICNIIPISRSFFKLYEILKSKIVDIKEKSNVCCICEGPGGFIQCLNDHYDINNIFGITLIDQKNNDIPYWNKKILQKENIKIFFSKDGTSNIYKIENSESFINMILKISGKVEMVTSDGGFDYSNDYNNQEESSYQLLFCEIYICLHIQKLEGDFIIKFFDLFSYKTIQLLYLLYNCYSEIIIYKPSFSRLSNSEKYIICRGFKGIDKTILELLKTNYNNFENIYINIPEKFIILVNEYNKNYINNQYLEIKKIIENIKNGKISNKPSKKQVNSAIQWCKLHDLPINQNCIYLNNKISLIN